MKITKLLISALLLLGFIYFGNNPLALSSATIPPLGKFFNPHSGIWANARAAADETAIPSDLPVNETVTIKYDERLVPHIFANNSHDLYYTQGYITAKHRLWQMDLTARSTAGRLSEVLGERTLEVDKETRQLGLPFAAENAIKGWSKGDTENDNIESYIAGINAYISSLSPKDYPLEFKLLDYAPEEWTMLHSAHVMKAMARTLAGRSGDATASNTKAFLGESAYNDLFEEYNPKQSPIIPAETSWDFITKKEVINEPIAPSLSIGYNDYSPEDKHEMLMGSNNWAVSSSKTKTGSTILAGDPHLSLTLPSIWFEAQLHAPDHNAYGVGIAGLHSIIIGFNENIAWSETNVGHDVIDWFEMKWTDETKTSYLLNGKPQEVVNRIETYKVKGKPSVIDTVKYAVWGPIFEADANDISEVDLAMRWLAHDEQPISEITTFENLNRATNFDEYRSALSTYVSPAQNFVFASKDGDIAITVAGRLPVRADQQGRFVQSGDDYRNDWPDMIPFEHNPYVKNPNRGFVSSANQHSTSPDYPYYYSGGLYFEDYRGRRLNDRLGEMDNITGDDMKALQYDSYSILAAEVVPIITSSKNQETNSKHESLKDILRGWDFNYTSDALAPVVFDIYRRHIYNLIWDEFQNAPLPIHRPETWKTVQLMEEQPNSKWFDIKSTDRIESMSNVIAVAWDSTAVAFSKLKADNPDLTWNDRRNTKIMHLGRIPAFSRTDITSAGNAGTLNAVTSTTGPSWRMVVEFENGAVNAQGVYPGGQSGNPGSIYYDNMIDTWAKGEYYPIHFLKDVSDSPSSILSSTTLK